jgi:phytoene dehydrogenase-like protein
VNLAAHGVRYLHPPVCLAHPLDGQRAGAVRADLRQTAEEFGDDATAWLRLTAPLVASADRLVPYLLSPMRSWPADPVATVRFLRRGMASSQRQGHRFKTPEARAVLAGVGAHSMQPLDRIPSGAFGLLLTVLAHVVGWPVVEGGSGRLATALAAELSELGGHVTVDSPIDSLAALPAATAVLLDITPRQFITLTSNQLPARYRRWLTRYRYGPGVCKLDWALSGPVPWASPVCADAGTVHVGGSLTDVAAAEDDVSRGRHPARPFVIVVQPGIVDGSRAPSGRQTLWAYCHVPSGSTMDLTAAIEAQIERFAPGFRDVVLARSTRTAEQMQQYNANYVGGDINGGASTLRQTVFRPVPRWNPYRTPLNGVYLCSAATPPGGGVHGMSGWHAARMVLRDKFPELAH